MITGSNNDNFTYTLPHDFFGYKQQQQAKRENNIQKEIDELELTNLELELNILRDKQEKYEETARINYNELIKRRNKNQITENMREVEQLIYSLEQKQDQIKKQKNKNEREIKNLENKKQLLIKHLQPTQPTATPVATQIQQIQI